MPAIRETLRETDLPADFATAIQPMATDGDPPATLEEAVGAFDRLWTASGMQLTLDQLFRPETTRHTVDFGGRVEHVPCVLDALIVGLVVDPNGTEVRSLPPGGEPPVRVSLRGDSVDVVPQSAVFSLGVAVAEAANPEAAVELLEETDSVVMASCSYIKAFPHPAAFERWEAGLTDAAVMRVGADELLAFARWAARDWVVGEADGQG